MYCIGLITHSSAVGAYTALWYRTCPLRFWLVRTPAELDLFEDFYYFYYTESKRFE